MNRVGETVSPIEAILFHDGDYPPALRGEPLRAARTGGNARDVYRESSFVNRSACRKRAIETGIRSTATRAERATV